ncbi:MAG: VOC family protein [Pseudomonadota bacterium]
MFNVVALDHIVLRTARVEQLISFYRDVLGMHVERRLDIGLIQLRAGPALIDLVPVDSELGQKGGGVPDRTAPNLEHFCLRIDPFDADGLRAHLESFHLIVSPVAERYGADGFGPSLYVEDPDGNTVELKGRPIRPPLPAPVQAGPHRPPGD